MKTKVLRLLLVSMMVLTGSLGLSSTVFAGNVSNMSYSFNNTSESGTSTWRAKQDNTYVYVYPQSGPSIRYIVQGSLDGAETTVAACSNEVRIPTGVQGSISNTVYTSGKTMARLRYGRISYAQEYTSGVWSPDSTQNYTIYN